MLNSVLAKFTTQSLSSTGSHCHTSHNSLRYVHSKSLSFNENPFPGSLLICNMHFGSLPWQSNHTLRLHPTCHLGNKIHLPLLAISNYAHHVDSIITTVTCLLERFCLLLPSMWSFLALRQLHGGDRSHWQKPLGAPPQAFHPQKLCATTEKPSFISTSDLTPMQAS